MESNLPNGYGRLGSLVGSVPGAGNEATLTQPVTTRWRVIGVHIQLAADINVANRCVNLIVQRPSGVQLTFPVNAVITASQVRDIAWGAGVVATPLAVATAITGTIPVDLVVNGQTTFTTRTDNIQAGDAFAAMGVVFEEWVEPL